ERLAKEREKLSSAEAELKDMDGRYTRLTKEYDEVQDEMEKCRKEFASYERRNIKYKEDIKYTKKQTKKLATAVEKEEKKAQDALDRYNQAEENLPKLKELVPVLEEEQKKEDAKLEEIYESLKVTAILFFLSCPGEEAKLTPLAAAASEAKTVYEGAKEELRLREEKILAREKELEAVNRKIEELELRLHDMKRQGATMVEERGELQEQVKEGKSRVERLTKEEEACRRRIGELRARCEEYKQSLAAASSRSAMLTKLLAARKRGGELQGVSLHGRLGDLGTIPAKYDVAASTA
ncbi:SMC4, partial [Symbiodinium sp. KB8]